MATEVIMPKAGMAMERGTVIQWFKDVGDRVEAGEPLLEIETDKVAMEVEAEVSGYLLATLYHEGDEVPVITTIGYIGEQGETPPESGRSETGPSEPSGVTATAQPGSNGAGAATGTGAEATSERRLSRSAGTVPATPAARRRAEETGTEIADVSPSGTHGEVRLRDVETYLTERGTGTRTDPGTVPAASSLARKIAEERGIDLAAVSGSGPGGRIVKRDVLAAPPARGEARSGRSERATLRAPLKGMRKAIAAKMSESHHTVPPVTLNRPVDVDAFLGLRTQINAVIPEEQRVSVTDMLVKVVALALQDAPFMRTTI
ncbi:MAG: E3 binding domain-containing protein, partial [Alkalispirochaeta sp.]